MSTQIRGFAPRDARHVAERAARGGERVVAVDPRRARLVQEHVRERVRQMARDRDEPVVRVGVDRDGTRAERGDEAVHEPVALRRRRRRVGVRNHVAPSNSSAVARVRAARLGAADRMAADEARRRPPRPRRPAPFVEPTSVTRAPGGARVEHRREPCAGSVADGRGDERELGVRERLGEIGAAASTAPRSAAIARCVRVGIPADDVGDPGAPRGERRRRADQARCRRRRAAQRIVMQFRRRSRTAITPPASARRRGRRGRATAARSGAGRRASRSGGRAAPRAPPRSRRGTRSRPRR